MHEYTEWPVVRTPAGCHATTRRVCANPSFEQGTADTAATDAVYAKNETENDHIYGRFDFSTSGISFLGFQPGDTVFAYVLSHLSALGNTTSNSRGGGGRAASTSVHTAVNAYVAHERLHRKNKHNHLTHDQQCTLLTGAPSVTDNKAGTPTMCIFFRRICRGMTCW